MAGDDTRSRVVLYGGDGKGDTWEFDSAPRAPAKFTVFGSGCAGSSGTPALDAAPNSLPYIGQELVLELTQLPTTLLSTPFGLLGASKTSWGSVTLPLALDPFGFPACVLHVSGDVAQALQNAGGRATWRIRVPYASALVQAPFFVQGVVLDLGSAGGAVLTNAGEGVIGAR